MTYHKYHINTSLSSFASQITIFFTEKATAEYAERETCVHQSARIAKLDNAKFYRPENDIAENPPSHQREKSWIFGRYKARNSKTGKISEKRKDVTDLYTHRASHRSKRIVKLEYIATDRKTGTYCDEVANPKLPNGFPETRKPSH